MSQLTESSAWKALVRHKDEINTFTMRDLFDQDDDRFSKFSLRFNDILFDHSKNRVTEATMTLLLNLAREAGIELQLRAMFRGEKINDTERSAVYTRLCAIGQTDRLSSTAAM